MVKLLGEILVFPASHGSTLSTTTGFVPMFGFNLGLGWEKLILTAGTRGELDFNPGSHGCKPSAPSLSYSATINEHWFMTAYYIISMYTGHLPN